MSNLIKFKFGKTTTNHGHYHYYIIDETGKGITTDTVFVDENETKRYFANPIHTHIVYAKSDSEDPHQLLPSTDEVGFQAC